MRKVRTDTHYLIAGVNPLKLIVKLKGELKEALPSVAGIYIRGPNAEYNHTDYGNCKVYQW